MAEYYHAGECPSCGQGLLLMVKSPSTGSLLVMCDECETQWESPEAAFSGRFIDRAAAQHVEPAGLVDIENKGWRAFVRNIGST